MKKSIVLLCLLSITYSLSFAQIPTDGLVGYWPFNGNANDESGNGNHGIVNGASLAEDRFGNFNSAYEFDGNDDKIAIIGIHELGIKENVTYSVWGKVTSENNCDDLDVIISTNISGQNGISLSGSSCKGVISKGSSPANANGIIVSVTSLGFDPFEWNHYVFVSTLNDGLFLYLNGVEIGNNTSTFIPININEPMEFGHARTSSGRYFKGFLDDISIYERALTAEEVHAIYTENPSPTQLCEIMFCDGENVGIGTDTPDAKLTVNGDIHTKEVRVDLNGFTAPDFVFEEGYDLSTLEETEKYIMTNKHLPDIPSGKKMETQGIDLKELNLKLLQKVEEMTLHLIDQNKEIKVLKSRIEELEKQKPE